MIQGEGSNSDEIYETLEYECYNSELPKTFEDTQRSKDKEKWDFAMREELNMMKTRQVWELVDPPANKTIIGSKCVYNIKHDEENKPKKYKARLVALGFKQKAGIDYGETFSPVVNFSIVKLMFIVLVPLLGWNQVQLDVKSAYLYGKLNEKVYLKQPPGFIVKDAESKVYLLHKALYGLHQSGRRWNCELDHILKNLKFDELLWSNCLYKNKDVILVIYVDDIIVFGKTLNKLYLIPLTRSWGRMLEIIGRAVSEMKSLSIPVQQGGHFHDVIFCMMLAYIKGLRILCGSR
ncbi:Retrovirus-related Pol polyprotein from transposon RE1 [Araneus ventricosus]|uniref:Retrovirus-related Pol polyprotein from transposon RE1 n=1 Tax=Araneus ventricosus TaxID=182803 RepID=A0A4Y2LI74_ARAVE|nr:Retrovirus-related Pol polyprotein from transposon RE1 [Araneus ventricosus]